MRVTIKTLQQHTFSVDINATETVADLKKKIENAKGKDLFPTAGQKLIYAGKMLDDAKTLQQYDIDEKNFVVVMVSKKSTSTSLQPVAESAGHFNVESESQNIQEDSAMRSVSPSDQAPEVPTESSDGRSVASSAVLTGTQYGENVRNIVDMGFPEDDVKSALRASFNNPDRAVEYLTTGIPNTLQPASQTIQQPDGAGTELDNLAQSGSSEKDEENPFEFLRNQPQFQQMCSVLRENPSYLPSFMQELRDSNPQLLLQISRNQEAFISLINSTSNTAGQPTDRNNSSSSDARAVAPPAGTQFIQISSEEKAAVDRLKDLGFSEAYVIQVYMACDKNETLAANILLEDADKD